MKKSDRGTYELSSSNVAGYNSHAKSLTLTDDQIKKSEVRLFSQAEMCSLRRLAINFEDSEVYLRQY